MKKGGGEGRSEEAKKRRKRRREVNIPIRKWDDPTRASVHSHSAPSDTSAGTFFFFFFFYIIKIKDITRKRQHIAPHPPPAAEGKLAYLYLLASFRDFLAQYIPVVPGSLGTIRNTEINQHYFKNKKTKNKKIQRNIGNHSMHSKEIPQDEIP